MGEVEAHESAVGDFGVRGTQMNCLVVTSIWN